MMGVAGPGNFKVEFHADDGGLRERDAGWTHDGSAPAVTDLPDNFALARAIHAGR